MSPSSGSRVDHQVEVQVRLFERVVADEAESIFRYELPFSLPSEVRCLLQGTSSVTSQPWSEGTLSPVDFSTSLPCRQFR